MRITEKLKRKLAVSFAIHEKPVSSFLKTIKEHVFVDLGARAMPAPFNNKIFSWSHFWKEAKEEGT